MTVLENFKIETGSKFLNYKLTAFDDRLGSLEASREGK